VRILVVGPHFTPDTAPTGTILARTVEELALLGHELDVVTSLPWYEDHDVDPRWRGRVARREKTPWGGVTRLWPFPTSKAGLAGRAAGFVGFSTLVGAAAIARGGRPDVVLAQAPPLTLAPVAALAARRYGVPLILGLQDIFPDVAVEVGAITNPRVIDAARHFERFCYRCADALVVLSRDMVDNVTTKVELIEAAQRPEVVEIPNFVDVDAIVPGDRMTAYRAELGLDEADLVVMYAGNLGHSQPFDDVVALADALAGRTFDGRRAVVVVNGDGVMGPWLRDQAKDRTNLVVRGYQPVERLGEVLATADVHLVVLKPDLARSSVPSKTYSAMAAGRPVVAAVDAGTEIDRILRESGGGVPVAAGSVTALVDAVTAMLTDGDRRRRCGRAARRHAEIQASPAAVAAAYGELFDGLVDGPRGHSGGTPR
jgi:colanic acid biosynthesis glycosyl transferase WcaI